MRRNLFLITLIVLFCACQKNEMANEVNLQKGITCKVPGFEIANQTKTTLKFEVDDKGNQVLKFNWNSSDSVAVFGSTGTQQLAMSMKEIPVGTSAANHVNFTISEDFLLKKDNTYFAYAPIKNKSIYLTANAVPFDLSGQIQMTNEPYDTDNLGAYDYIVSGATTAKENNVAEFLFHHMCCPIRIKIEKVKAGTYQSITFSSSKAVFAVKGSINVTNDTYNDGELASSVEIAYNEPVSVGQDGTLYAWMMIAPVSGEQLSDATLKVITRTDSGTEEEYELTNTVTEFVRGYAYAINASGSGGTIDPGPEFVDLGLPSGTLWATTNVGAENPEDAGSYVSWGEVDEHENGDYSPDSYSYYQKDGASWSYKSDKKYYKDFTYALEDANDIAAQKDGYRLPYSWEWNELYSNCTITEVSVNNIHCLKFTHKKNDAAFILLPKNGYKSDNTLTEAGDKCCYWSKNADKINSTSKPNTFTAYSFSPTITQNIESEAFVIPTYRHYGLGIRAVKKSKAPEYVDLGLSVKWAKINLGAAYESDQDSPCFAWGELCNKADSYNGNMYIYYKTSSSCKKYNSDDNKLTLLAEDDVATFHYGTNWRIPTKSEWDELLTQCNWTKWQENDKTIGWKVSNKNDESKVIYLPFVNVSYPTSGPVLYYWSSSLYTSSEAKAYCLQVSATATPSSSSMKTDYRYRGFCIHPVYVGTSNE